MLYNTCSCLSSNFAFWEFSTRKLQKWEWGTLSCGSTPQPFFWNGESAVNLPDLCWLKYWKLLFWSESMNMTLLLNARVMLISYSPRMHLKMLISNLPNPAMIERESVIASTGHRTRPMWPCDSHLLGLHFLKFFTGILRSREDLNNSLLWPPGNQTVSDKISKQIEWMEIYEWIDNLLL